MEKRLVMVHKDLNIWVKKGDVVEIIKVDEKSKLVYIYIKKHKKYLWVMESDIA